ncbi:hypothetical protein ACFZB9_24710 [Kitasatospora sp. NPDC008050]|uniref:hypothetical protein n=1 Tax=Kitasatospora sp. NPDC008050 TaxID=3364021 RepID=UPI0036E0EDDC
MVLDDPHADGAQIGAPGTTYHRVAITSEYGSTVVISTTDGYYAGQGGHSAMVRFPGGFTAEIHDGTLR